MRRSLVVVTPPASTALTTVGAVAGDLGTEDPRLASLIDQASGLIIDHIGRDLARATVTETFRAQPGEVVCGPLILSRTPVAVISALIEGGIAQDLTALDFDPTSGLLYRHTMSCMTVVTYDGGYIMPGQVGRDLPASLERACIDTVVALWWRASRGDPMIRSDSVEGVGSTSYLDPASGSAGALPPTVVAALNSYQSYGL